jgi:hypothetical protein
MSTVKNIFRGGLGINNKVAPERLRFDPELGIMAFESAENVLVDQSGAVVGLQGSVKIKDGQFHSILSGKEYGYIVQNFPKYNDSHIMRIDINSSGLSLTGVRSGLSMARMDWCWVNGLVFYSNGHENGMIQGTMSLPWKESISSDEQDNVQYGIPVAEHLGYNAGRIFMSYTDPDGKHILAFTKFGKYGLRDIARDAEQFPTRILMYIPAADGHYISDEENIYFLSGLNPESWTLRKVAGYPVLEWGLHNGTVDPSFLGFDTNVPSMLVATANGPCLLMPSGQIVNLIDKAVTMPDCINAGIALLDETLIIQTGTA